MIDLHLLTKIARDDYSFLKSISRKICDYNDRFTNELQQSIDNLNWNHAYFLLLEFYKRSATYSTSSFMGVLKSTLDKVKISDNPITRYESCQEIISKIEDGTDSLRSRYAPETPVS